MIVGNTSSPDDVMVKDCVEIVSLPYRHCFLPDVYDVDQSVENCMFFRKATTKAKMEKIHMIK